MTSVNQHPGQSDHMLMCKQWWRVCWMYGDQEKFYRQLYGKKNASRAIVTSTSSTLSNYDNVYSELSNKATVTTVNSSGQDRVSAFPHTLPRQRAYQELYGLGATLPGRGKADASTGDKSDKKNSPEADALEIPTISSYVPANNSFHGSLLNSGKSAKPRLFPYTKELCNDISVLGVSPETVCEQDTVLRQKVGSKKRARNGDRISTRETTTVTTMLTFERQILTTNK
ncbi:hypothetical protein RUM43_004225 [Polyplax serrata]|uniref:Uncharacterized protein n=1 Tax=Polyplax serrata TaxID=468196 RepID=A0AAN8SAN5_POLSC